MIIELVKKAQENKEEATLELLQRFEPLLRKYARKLNYEDAYEDITLYFIEKIMAMDLDKMRNSKDEGMVAYINVCITNFYNKRVRKIILAQREIALSDLTEEQVYYAEAQLAKEDATDIFVEFGMNKLLNQKELQIMELIYVEGYSTAEIARKINKSRQAVNQLKHRVLKKIEKIMRGI